MSHSKSSRHSAGFTLLEIMVAMLLLTVIVTSSVSLLFINIRGWDALTTESEAELDDMLINERINTMLSGLTPLVWQTGEGKRLAFTGEAKRLHFVSKAPQQYRSGGLFEYLLVEELERDSGLSLVLYYAPYLPDSNEFRLPHDGKRRVLIKDTGGLHFTFHGRKSPAAQPDWWGFWENDLSLYPEVIGLKLTMDREFAAEKSQYVRLMTPNVRQR